MKINKLWLITCLFPCAVFAQEHSFDIVGNIKNSKAGAKVFLAYSAPGKMMLDSCTVVNGKFSFKGRVSGDKKAFLQMLHEDKGTRFPQELNDAVGVYLENGEIQVTAVDSLKNATVMGTPLNDQDQQLRLALAPFAEQEKKMEADFAVAKKENNATKQAEVQQAYFAMDAVRKGVIDNFIQKNKNSYLSFMTLRTYVDQTSDADRAIKLFDQLGESIKTSKEGSIYNAMLNKARSIVIGSLAPDFSLPNTEGQEISLNSFKGKYVLIDFWASWCGPCRAENPNVVRAYNTYKNKGFTVLGVSLDGGNQAKEKWVKAIEMDQLTWDQVSDLKGWQSAVASQYSVSSIPANFLIDPAGKIIAKNLRGEALDKKLAEIL